MKRVGVGIELKERWVLRFGIAAMVSVGVGPVQPAFAGGYNCVAEYMNHADRQYESDDQKKEIERALSEMLTLSPSDLLKKRYADYQMHPRQWTAINILERYFLSLRTVRMDEKCFATSVHSSAARKAIRKQLFELKNGVPVK